MTRAGAAAWLLAVHALAAEPRACAVAHVPQARANDCLVAAATMVLGAWGARVTHDDLWRDVRMWTDGTSDFEIEEAVARRGFAAWSFTGDAGTLARIVEAGFPVVAAVDGRKHAVAVVAHRGGAFRIDDPAARGPSDEPDARLDARRAKTSRQLLLIVPASVPVAARLAARGVDVARIERENHAYRAAEWRLRAERDYPDARDPRRAELERRAEAELR